MSSTLQPPARPAPAGRSADQLLRQRLGALRRRLRFVATFRGAAWLVACVLATLVLTGLLDYRVHLPGLVRAFALTGMLAAAGVLIHRYLLQPLSEATDDLSLALRVEEHYPLLNDGLASTVQFLERTPPDGESASMRKEAVRRSLSRVDGVDFNRVVDARGLRSSALCAAVATAASVTLAVFWPALSATAVARVALPFSAVGWPKKTTLLLDEVQRRIGRNREYRLTGRVKGVIPRDVTIDVSHDGFPAQQKTFVVDPREHTFAIHLKPDEVQRNFRFTVHANDDSSEEYRVEVLPLPVLVAFDGSPSPHLRLQPPAYTDLPSPQLLPPGQGNLDIVAGTVVSLRAAVDRPLKRAWLEYLAETQGTTQAACLTPLGSADALGVLGSIVLSRAFYERVPATIDADRTRFSVTFRPSTNGMYSLHFEDENDLSNHRIYELRLRLDPAPGVKLERPSPSRDVLKVLPTAELPLQIIVEDSQFAVRSAWLEYSIQGEAAPHIRPLYHNAEGMRQELAPWAGVAALGASPPRLRIPRLEFDRKFAIRSLRHADGSGVKEGDIVVLQAFADDFDDVSVGKEPGRSHQVQIQIVGREKLDNELNQEQGRIQKELEKLRAQQREALAKVKEIESRARKGGKMLPEREAAEAEVQAQKAREEAASEQEKADRAKTEAEREQHRRQADANKREADKLDQKALELKRQAQQFAEAEQLQQQIRERIGNDREGLRAEVEKQRETMRQNNLENTNAMERMKRVAQELDRLTEKELEHIEPRLTNARKLAELEDPKTREERRAELEKRAREAEQEARAAEERAKKLNEKAASEEAKGDESSKQQAERARKEAQEASRKASEKHARAERERRDAAEMADPEKARRTLADARRGQEEVDRTLSRLLQELEPWSSTLEVNSEAGRILEEQKELEAQLDDLGKKGMTGKNPKELTPDQRAELEQAKEAQKRLQERTANLLNQMKKLAESREKSDPDTADDLKKAADQAEQNNLQGHMKSAQESIGENKLNEARKKQREAIAELENLAKELKDSREARLDRLARKLREAEQRVEKLMDEQEKLQRKIREAAAEKDPKKREDELKRLAKRQKELRREADEAIKQISRAGNDRAREMMQEAREDMADALKDLSRGKKDDEKQEDVLDRLEEARRELERARKKAEEELAREQLVRVGDVLRRIRERQEGHQQESKRIQDGVLQSKAWTRGVKQSLRNLGENQNGLSQEAVAVARKDLTSAPVFARMVDRSARAMVKASERIAGLVRESPPLEKLPDSELGTEQARALRYLDQLLASLKEAADDPRPLSRQDDGEGEDGGKSGPQGDDSLPPLAQLKLLRALQKEVNDRTEVFRKKHPDAEKLGPKEKAELQEIRQEQQEVADLLERYTRPAGEGPDADGGPAAMDDKKTEKK